MSNAVTSSTKAAKGESTGGGKGELTLVFSAPVGDFRLLARRAEYRVEATDQTAKKSGLVAEAGLQSQQSGKPRRLKKRLKCPWISTVPVTPFSASSAKRCTRRRFQCPPAAATQIVMRRQFKAETTVQRRIAQRSPLRHSRTIKRIESFIDQRWRASPVHGIFINRQRCHADPFARSSPCTSTGLKCHIATT